MADTAQVIYEYSDGNSVSFWTDNLTIEWKRPGLSIDVRVDGTIVVTDTGASQRIFSCSGTNLSGDDVNTMDTHLTGAITYSGAYPRLTTINLDGDTTLTNVEVACTMFKVTDQGNGKWSYQIQLTEKDQ